MKSIVSLVALVFTGSILSGCTGLKHIGYICKGQSKSAVMQEFGPPEEVVKSIKNVETWEYTMGGGVQTYTFEGDTCVTQHSRSRK